MQKLRIKTILLAALVALSLQLACTHKKAQPADRVTDVFIDELMRKMTLEEKIGQLNLLDGGDFITGNASGSDIGNKIKEGKVGALLNIRSVEKIRDAQRVAVEESRLGIPLIFGLDVLHGYSTIFPIPLAQACSWDLEAIQKSDRIAATEATAEGLNWTFAPMVDIARDPRWGRVAEGAGEDTWLGCRIAEARVRGFQGNNLKDVNTMLACVKHFAAYGAAEGGREYNTVDMSEVSLLEWYLPPYKAAVDAGVGSVMTSFNEIAGVPSTSNHWLLTDLLKKEWGFQGFVVTDYTAINELVNHGVAADNKAAAALALNAGVDMDMVGSTFLDYLKQLAGEKKVSVSTIDNAVRRVLEAKKKLGLFDTPYRYCDEKREAKDLMTPENLQFAREFTAKSCVLLKNVAHTLPIPSSVKTIAVIGPLGDSQQDMLGVWSAAGQEDRCVTLLQGIKNKLGEKTSVICEKGCNTNDDDRSGFNAALKAARKADYVLLALGENCWMSGEAASRANIDLPGVQNELAKEIIKLGKPTVVVLFNGRPLAITELAEIAPAILETWFGGTEAGNGIADVLFGDYNPSGKLTMTFPRSVGQVPIYYNSKNTGRPLIPDYPNNKYVSRYLDLPNDPLYPFGYGLSYTSFEYSNLQVDVNGAKINISVDVKNTGKVDGEEVVQLYTHDKVATLTRPVKELKGFAKIIIPVSETRTVNFSLTPEDLSFVHSDLKNYWEPGEFEVFVGTNSVKTISKTFWLDK
jgi:beta-glucosidase